MQREHPKIRMGHPRPAPTTWERPGGGNAGQLPVSPGWLYEPKLDGCRVLFGKDGRRRRGGARPGGAARGGRGARVAASANVVLDGEVVVLDERGQSDFDAACARLSGRRSLSSSSTSSRWRGKTSAGVRSASGGRSSPGFSPRRDSRSCRSLRGRRGDGDVGERAELRFEGVVAKYSGAPYQGGRTALWQKLIVRRPTTE